MTCYRSWKLERDTRRIWCIGGPSMTIEEVAFQVGFSPKVLRILLGHIPNLSHYTIRHAGQETLLLTNSTEGRALGFLADGDAFDILERDSAVRRRIAKERDDLCAHFMKTK